MKLYMDKTPQDNKQQNILLLDFAQETNSGDAAMQISTILLVKKYFSNCNLYVSTIFGANQFPEALSQFHYTNREDNIIITGGLYPTLIFCVWSNVYFSFFYNN